MLVYQRVSQGFHVDVTLIRIISGIIPPMLGSEITKDASHTSALRIALNARNVRLV